MLLGRQRLSPSAMHAPRPPGLSPLSKPRVGRPGRRLVPGTGGGREGIRSEDERASGVRLGAGWVREDATSRKSPWWPAGSPAGRRRGSGCRRAAADWGSRRCVHAEHNDRARDRRRAGPRGLPWLGLEACAGPACSRARRRVDGGTAMAARTRPGPRRARAPARAAAAAAAGGRGGRSRAAGGGAGSADKGGAEGGGGRGAAASRSRAGRRAATAARLLGGGDRERELWLRRRQIPPERARLEGEGAKMAAGGRSAHGSRRRRVDRTGGGGGGGRGRGLVPRLPSADNTSASEQVPEPALAKMAAEKERK